MSTEIELLRTHSLASALRQEIERLILAGEFAPGDRINENLLASRFAVSRGPVREACRALVEKGFLELIPKRGVFVRRLDEVQAGDLYDVRAGLFAAGARLFAMRASDDQLARLEELVSLMDEAAGDNALDDYYPLNLAFHEAILAGAGNTRLSSAYRELIKELHLFRERGLLHGGGLAISNAEHRDILGALQRRDPQQAMEMAFIHVERGKARMVLAAAPGVHAGAA